MSRASFDAQRGPDGALLIGSSDEVVDKILRQSDALGGISRISFQMNVASPPKGRMMRSIDSTGARVAPALCQAVPVEHDWRAGCAGNGRAFSGHGCLLRWLRTDG